jgi:hypothetical protein
MAEDVHHMTADDAVILARGGGSEIRQHLGPRSAALEAASIRTTSATPGSIQDRPTQMLGGLRRIRARAAEHIV